MKPERRLTELVRSFLTREGWTPLPADDEPIVIVPVAGATGEWTLAVWCTDDDRLVVYSVLGVPVGSAHRRDVDGFLARMNDGMVLGNFECDAEEGIVRFKTSIGVAGVDVTDALLRELVYPNVATVDRYLDIVTRVATGELTIADALALADAQS